MWSVAGLSVGGDAVGWLHKADWKKHTVVTKSSWVPIISLVPSLKIYWIIVFIVIGQ